MDAGEMSALVTKLRQQMTKLAREMEFLRKRYTDEGFTRSQIHALLELSKSKSMNQKDLATRLLLNKSSISRLLKPLHKASYITITSDDVDKRNKFVCLTARGKKIVTDINNRATRQVTDALEYMDLSKIDAFIEGLKNYTYALMLARTDKQYSTRPMMEKDSTNVAHLLKKFHSENQGHKAKEELLSADELTKRYANQGCKYILLCKSDRIIGGIGILACTTATPQSAILENFFIHKTYCDYEIQALLLDGVQHEARDLGYKTLYAHKSAKSAAPCFEMLSYHQLEHSPLNSSNKKKGEWFIAKL